MKHCIQISIGGKHYDFSINTEREADLSAPLDVLINKYLASNTNYIAQLKEIVDQTKVNTDSKSDISTILSKEVLSKGDIDNILTNYLGSLNIKQLAGYFDISRTSDVLSKFNILFRNGYLLGGASLSTSSPDIFLQKGVKNRILMNNERTVIILNPESSVQEATSILSTIYAINQFREPTSAVFKSALNIVENYNGKLRNNIKDMNVISKMIYLFSNINLEPETRDALNAIISADIEFRSKLINTKSTISGTTLSLSKALNIDLSKKEIAGIKVDETLTDQPHTATISQLFKFASDMWRNDTTITDSQVKEVLGLTEVDTRIYPHHLWYALTQNVEAANVVYSYLSLYAGTKTTMQDKLTDIIISQIQSQIPYTTDASSIQYKYDASLVNIADSTNFLQNRMLNIRRWSAKQIASKGKETYGDTFKVAVIYKTDDGTIAYKIRDKIGKGVQIPTEITKNTSFLYLDAGLDSGTVEEALEYINNRKNFKHISIDDSNPSAVKWAKMANSKGYSVDIHINKNTDIEQLGKKYSYMPIHSNTDTIRITINKSQKGLLSGNMTIALDKNGETVNVAASTLDEIAIPIVARDDQFNNMPINDSFVLQNDNDANDSGAVTLVDKYILDYQPIRVAVVNLNDSPFMIGDMVDFKGFKYIYLGLNTTDNNYHILSADTGENEVVEDKDIKYLAHLTDKANNKVTSPVNNGIVWCRTTKGTNLFYDTVNNKTSNKPAYFDGMYDFTTKGISNDQLHSIYRDNAVKNIYIFKRAKLTSIGRTVAAASNIDPLHNYTLDDYLAKLNNRIGGGEINVVWFDKNGNGLENFIQKGDIGRVKTLSKRVAFTNNGIIYLNKDKATLNSYMHELSHIILAVLKLNSIENPKRSSDDTTLNYYDLLNSIQEVPAEFVQKYVDEGTALSDEDIKEEYLVSLFAQHFTDTAPSIDNILNDESFESFLSNMFNLENISKSDANNIMTKFTIADVMKLSKDAKTYNQIFKNDKFKNITKLSALKQELMKNGIITEEC